MTSWHTNQTKMTLSKFQKLLKQIHPSLRLRQRRYGDIVGLYAGSGYICRLTKGELATQGYKLQFRDPKNLSSTFQMIAKRGRKTVINILRNYRWVKNHRQRSLLMGHRASL